MNWRAYLHWRWQPQIPPEVQQQLDQGAQMMQLAQQQIAQGEHAMQAAQQQIAEMQKAIETEAVKQEANVKLADAKVTFDRDLQVAKFEHELALQRLKFDHVQALLLQKNVHDNQDRDDEALAMAIQAAEAAHREQPETTAAVAPVRSRERAARVRPKSTEPESPTDTCHVLILKMADGTKQQIHECRGHDIEAAKVRHGVRAFIESTHDV